MEYLSIKLAKLAGSDNELIKTIYKYARRRKIGGYVEKYFSAAVIGLVIIVIVIYNSFNSSSSISYKPNNSSLIGNSSRPTTGDLNPHKDSSAYNVETMSSSELKLLIKPKEDYSGWETTDYKTGSSPGCYNFTPRYNKDLDNRLEVNVGINTDVVIKLMSIAKRKCIRYVYIRSGSTFNIENIPEGQYYLKIAYGKNWRQKVDSGKCVGKFTYNPLYKKGEKILDFNKRYTGVKTVGEDTYKTYKLPSYFLTLDVVATDFQDRFNTNVISEDDFNDQE